MTASAIASAAASPTDSGDHTVTDFVSTPEFTATKTTAYEAHGINGTEIHNGTSTYTADTYLATANASAHGIPHNELTACQINGTLADNGPFCSPIHQQNMWVGFTYASKVGTIFDEDHSDTFQSHGTLHFCPIPMAAISS